MSQLTDKIKACQDKPLLKFYIPEWDENVWLSTLSIADQKKLAQLVKVAQDKKDDTLALCQIIVLFCCDENGDKLFTNADIPWLEEKNYKVLSSLLTAILDWNKPATVEAEKKD